MIDYDGRLFRGIQNAETGEVSGETVFRYHHEDELVWATYSGGSIRFGTLIATVGPEGELFISCSFGSNKYWCPRVGDDHSGRLRLDGTVYPVVLNREMDPARLDRVWAARLRKLQKPAVQARQPGGGGEPPALDTPRPDSWWTFHVVSRS